MSALLWLILNLNLAITLTTDIAQADATQKKETA